MPKAASDTITVALVGNPNTGKTTLFNALTGYSRHVANYPGVTVELASGPVRGTRRSITLLDLPGTYSLAAVSPDEVVVCNAACGRLAGEPRPDAVLAIVDAANLPRNLYLVSQLLELNLPMVIALNMADVAEQRGLAIDAARLSAALGAPVIPIVATRDATLRPLLDQLEGVANLTPPAARAQLPPPIATEIERLIGKGDRASAALVASPAEALRILIDQDGLAPSQYIERGGSAVDVDAARARLSENGLDAAAAEVRARYAWINTILDGVIRRPLTPVKTWSDRVDRVLTHPIGGFVMLLAVLALVFQAIFRWAEPLMTFIDSGVFGTLKTVVAAVLPEGVVRSLLVDGVIAGVGGVLVFLPQIMILFAAIAVLEDCGYMSRAAFMMDRVMRALGLSGRALIPLLSSFACAVPAIMGTRVIADRRERFVTIMIAPFMSCSARLPVYVLLIGAFVPQISYLGGWVALPGLVMLAMYLVGVVVAIPIAWLLKKTAFSGPAPAFLMELPSYKLPRLRAIWQRVFFAARGFVVRAGTVILLVNLIVWTLAYFPRSDATAQRVQQRGAAEGWDEARLARETDGAYLRESLLGRMGHAIEPAIRPIGWDWRIGMAVLASFPAREVVVATLGTIFNLDSGAEEERQLVDLRSAMRSATWPASGAPIFTLPVALSIMVFFALCAQCASTLVMIGREMGSWVWPLISFTGMTTLAYFAAWGVAAAARAAGL